MTITIAFLCLAGVLLFLRKPAAAIAPAATPAAPAIAPPAPHPRPMAPAVTAADPAALSELAALTWLRAEDLPEPRRQSITGVFRHVPRPPRLLQQLISQEFVNNASLEELAELISSEPLVAAKVLATANSPMFGLSTPVTGLHHAISTLGLITLRSLCLQYMLIKSFKADSPERQTLLGNLWNASSLASELSLKLAQALNRPEPGRLVTLVVLSFLGRLATTATMPRGLLATIPVGSFLQRTRQEQTLLGLSASEIGGLLMREWDLPATLVDEVREVDPTLILDDQNLDLAICYLCARLGERLASGELTDLARFDLRQDTGADLHRLQARLAHPAWQAVAAALAEPALCGSVNEMSAALRNGGAGLTA